MKTVKTTVGAILKSEDKILLTLRDHDPFRNSWCIPGGHIEFGEHPETAVKREVWEETGLTILRHSFFNYYSEYYPDLDWHAVALIFLAEAEGTLKPQAGEVKELRWVTPEEALALPLAFNHRDIISDYLKR